MPGSCTLVYLEGRGIFTAHNSLCHHDGELISMQRINRTTFNNSWVSSDEQGQLGKTLDRAPWMNRVLVRYTDRYAHSITLHFCNNREIHSRGRASWLGLHCILRATVVPTGKSHLVKTSPSSQHSLRGQKKHEHGETETLIRVSAS